MGQIEGAPLRVVEFGLGEFEVAGLGKVSLPVAEAQIAGRVGSVAELNFHPKSKSSCSRGATAGKAAVEAAGASAASNAPVRAQAERAKSEEAERANPDCKADHDGRCQTWMSLFFM